MDGSANANAALSIALNDPGTNASDGRIDLRELVNGLSSIGTLATVNLTGSANITLPLSIPFLGVTPGPDTAIVLDWSDIKDPSTIDVQLPDNLLDLPNFTNMDAGTFVSLLGQIANFLEDFRRNFSATDIPFVGPALDDVLKFADQFHDALLYDDNDTDTTADDTPKLLDANNAPTFTTVQELVAKLVAILGPGVPVAYNQATDELTFDLDLSGTLGQIDVPVNFSLVDLAPLLELSSTSAIRLTASGGLSLRIGVYLGDAGAVALSDSSALSGLKNGITFSDRLSIVPPADVRVVYGRLSGDAEFTLARNGAAPVTIALARSVTEGNATLADIAADINAAIGLTSLAGLVTASVDNKGTPDNAADDQLVLAGDGATTSLVLAAQAGSVAVRELGVGASMTAVEEGGARKIRVTVPGLVGRPAQDAGFTVAMNTVDGGAPKTVTVNAADLRANRNILDVVGDVQRALNTAGFTDKIEVSSQGRRLVFTAVAPGTTSFTITAGAGSVAVQELGLATSQSGSSADLIIVTRDGTTSAVVLDGLTTLGQVRNAIKSQTGNRVDVQYTANSTRLRLVDSSTGATIFEVKNAPGSTAATQLGILNKDTRDPATDPADGKFDSGLLGGIQPLDRLFIENAVATASLAISTPGGLNAAAKFGFVGIEASGNGTLTGTITAGLKRPEDTLPGGRIVIGQLLGDLANLDDYLALDIGGGGSFDLGISLAPAFPAISTGPSPHLTLTITDLGDLLEGVPGAFAVTTTGFDQLANFQNFGFADVLAALRALVDFLQQFQEFGFLNESIPLINVKIGDILSFADDFAAALDQVAANPAATIQVLEDKLKQAFGIPVASDLLDLALVRDGDADILRIDLDFSPSFSRSLPINFDLPLPEVLNLSGGANLVAQGALDLHLALGIDLDDIGTFWVFGDTGITGNLSAAAADLSFTAALGGFGVRIVEDDPAVNAAAITGNFNLGLKDAALTGAAGKRRIELDSLLGSFDTAIDAGISGSVSATLPVYFPTESIFKGNIRVGGSLGVSTGGGLQVGGTLAGGQFIEIPPDLFSINPNDFSPLDNLLLIVDGIDGFLGLLQDTLEGDLFGLKFPIVGDQLGSAATFIADFRDGFINDLREAIATAASPSENFISQKLFELLGPGGLNLLLDGDDPGTDVSVSDIRLTTNAATPGVAPKDVFMQWNLRLGGSLVNAGAGIDFDIGLPGLGLETRGGVQLDLDWELAFGFGVDLKQGFYLDVSDANELEVNLDVTLPGAGLTGRLGFLQINADDNGSHLGATFAVDLKNRVNPADTLLGIAELGNIGLDVGIAAEAVVDLALSLSLNSDLVPGATTVFPKVVAGFYLDWGFGDRDTDTLVPLSGIGNAVKDGLHTVEFRNVGIDLGTYISDFLAPVVKEIQKITEPLQPLIDVLTAPIPVISDLAGQPITLIDIAALTGYVRADLIYAIADIIRMVNAIPTEAGPLVITLVDKFTVFDAIGGLTPDISSPTFNRASIARPNLSGFNFQNAVSGLDTSGKPASSQSTKEFTNGLAGKSFGDFISFPIFNDPGQLIGLLLGDNPTLIQFDLPDFSFKFTYSQYFPIFGPLGASITGTLGADIKLPVIGYDTLGVRQFFDSGFRNPELLFNGFFIGDLVNGVDVPELRLTGGLSAGVEINLGIAKAGVAGGIFAEINFDLHDPDKDGKIRLDELAKNFLNQLLFAPDAEKALAPLAIFDVDGRLYAKLFAFLKIDLFLFSIDEEFNITPEITLVDFDIPFTRIPTLATELPGGTLQLNMGTLAAKRLEGDITDKAEQFFVKQDGAGYVKVWSPTFGVSEGMAQRYKATNKIIALGGEGDDVIDLSGVTDAAIEFEVEGGNGNDTIKLGAGKGKVKGGAGDDQIWGSDGDDIIFGEGGNDWIDAKGGNDLVFGDGGKIKDDAYVATSGITDGNDVIIGGLGDDILIGGGGADKIGGDFDPNLPDPGSGGGNDVIIGDGAILVRSGTAITEIKDTTRGSGGNDVIRGGGGNDRIYGGKGDDNIEGNAGDDQIWGEDGFDVIKGGAGNDVIRGGKDDDTIDGNEGNDQIWGEDGRDTLRGGDGNDTIYGGAGADTIYGDAGNDFIWGEADGDRIWGGTGNDTIDAGSGRNYVYGEDGNDVITSGNDPDTIAGGAGDDVISSGDGTDEITGGDGNDQITSGSGRKTIHGNAGNDVINVTGTTLAGTVITGGTGNDVITIFGGPGLIIGNAGNDQITLGGSGDAVIWGDDENDSNPADDGDDVIVSGAGNDLIFGTGGNDTIRGGGGADTIFGGAGDDILYGGLTASGGDTAANVIVGGTGNDRIWGDLGNDVITGNDGDDVIFALAGNDDVQGNDGDDEIHGGAGDDLLVGNRGDDTIFGDAGNDVIWGGEAIHPRAAFDLANPANFTNPLFFDANEAVYPSGFTPPRITPVILLGLSVGGEADDKFSGSLNDWNDHLYGGDDTDFIFGGGGRDEIFGGGGDDYLDGGDLGDEVFGEGGNDIVRGGANDDVVHGDYKYELGSARVGPQKFYGDEGIDQVYGDGGSDFLFGDWAPEVVANDGVNPVRLSTGQRLYGGEGIDFLYAFAGVAITAGNAALQHEYTLAGDELHGGAGNDWLYGNLRRDVLIGDSGNDYLHGDYLSGPTLAQNVLADVTGGADLLVGGSGQDQLLGGGGDDVLYGGADTDWLEGQKGNDTLYGGGGIDFMVLDTRRQYFIPDGSPIGPAGLLPTPDQLLQPLDTFDGHFRNAPNDVIADDNATDIMLVEGTSQDDTILVGQLADGRIHVNFTTINPLSGLTESWEILAPWRAKNADGSLNPAGRPLVEQFRISGLLGDDTISFVAAPYVAFPGTPAAKTVLPLDIGDLNARSDDFVGVIDGGPGNDLLRGTAGRDRLDGGSGDDILYGLAGDDRLWGNSTAGDESPDTGEYDILFGGRGDDDLIGGPGINDLYAWTQHPKPAGDPDFGVFVNPDDPDGPVFDSNADLNGDGVPDRILEDTGLDRMLGGRNDDRLYGGTGLAFMYGNGGDDRLYRADGTEFESADGGLGGDAWKAFAKESGKVWYVAGTEADDVITVDFVTEPGVLGNRHIVTRLTNNNGSYSFAAQIRLDFSAQDKDGKPVWDLEDAVARLEELQRRGGGQTGGVNQTTGAIEASADTPVGTATVDVRRLSSTALEQGLLPGEGDFDVILVDALGGNDRIDVGPTVQKTVWIDAGAGDDRVTISGGNVILADKSEGATRNDTAAFSYRLGSPDGLDTSKQFTRLSIDNPDDADWYRFSLAAPPDPQAKLVLSSASDLDGLAVALFAADGTNLGLVPAIALGTDGTEAGGAHNSIATAYALPAVQSLARVVGLSIHAAGDVDYFRFRMDRATVSGDAVSLLLEAPTDQLVLELVDANDTVLATATQSAPLVRRILLDEVTANGLAAGDYYLRVRTPVASNLARYSLVFSVPTLQTYESSISNVANTAKESALNLGAYNAFPLVTGTTIGTGETEWFKFVLKRGGEATDLVTLSRANEATPLTLALLDSDGTTVLRSVTVTGSAAASLNLDGLTGGGKTYYLRVGGATAETAYELRPGAKATTRTIIESVSAGVLVRQEVRTVRESGQTVLDLSGKQTSSISLASLAAGTDYLVRVTSPNRVPTQYDLKFDLGVGDASAPENSTDLGAKANTKRRDVIIGGAGNDALQGGPGEDWIFGGPGNDVLSGGYDRQAEDLLFGGEGDDTFQLLTDDLPLIKGSTETYIPTFADRMDGGAGDDRVMYIGGDYDRLNRPIPDDVAIRWNRFLQRYEFTALVWDTANQEFMVAQEVVNASVTGPLTGFVGTVTFRLRVADPTDPNRGFTTVTAEINASDLVGVVEQLQAALDAQVKDANGKSLVTVESPDGILRLRAKGQGMELRASPSDPAVTVLGFAPLTAGSPIYKQTYIFYQTLSVERTVIDTKAGDDVVHGTPEFKYPNVPDEWGIKPGDYEQRALIGGLAIYGGAGADRLFGGALADTIDGGEGADVIFGGGGDDRLYGGPGRDLIAGNKVLEPDAYEFVTRAGVSGRNDLVTLAANLPAIRAGSTVSGLNIDLDDDGDWYVIGAAEAVRRFGDASGAVITNQMIEVPEMVDNEGTLVPTGAKLRAFLYAAENIADPGEPLNLVPRERFSGVPQFYLLHVTPELAPSPDRAGRALQLDGIDDRMEVTANVGALNSVRTTTVELWLRPEFGGGATLDFGGGKSWAPVVYKGNTTVASRTYSLWLNADGYLHFTSANGSFQDGVVNTPVGSIQNNQWYHFAGVIDRDNGVMRVYLNGVLVGTSLVGTSNAASNPATPLRVGATGESDPSYRNFKGRIDELRIWNVARSDADIQAGYERVLAGDEAGLVGYWRFEETSGDKAADTARTTLNPDDLSDTTNQRGTIVNGASGQVVPLHDANFGRALILPFGPGLYQIEFKEPLGQTVSVGEAQSLPGQTFSSIQLSGQPIVIPLGDIDGDGHADSVVSVSDNVLDGGTRRHFVRIAFGSANAAAPGLDIARYSPPITLELPAPLIGTNPADATARSFIEGVGDIDKDGYDDIAVSVTTAAGSRVYILFGRADWSNGDIAADAGLLGEYFLLPSSAPGDQFPNFNALTPLRTRVDAQVNFPATSGPGFAGFSDLNDRFAVRWTGQIRIDVAGTYRFFTASDDGSRLFIDGVQVVNNGGLHAFQEASGQITLDAGYHDIRLEFVENFGAAGIRLSWDPPGAALGKEVVPASVLFRDARDVINVATDRDVELTGFSGQVRARGAGEATPVVGTGLLAEYYANPTREALAFDGGDVVRVPGASALDLAGDFTIEARVRFDGFIAGETRPMPLVNKGDGTLAAGNYSLRVLPSGALRLAVTDGTGEEFIQTPAGALASGGWYEVAAVVNRGDGVASIIVNGATVAAGTIRTGANKLFEGDLLIGNGGKDAAGLSGFRGAIEMLALWAKARPAADVANDFADQIAGNEPALAGWWRFNESAGDKALDGTANGNDGLLGWGDSASAPARIQGQLRAFPDFDTLTPTHFRFEGAPLYAFSPADFAGFADLDDTFAARWSGQFFLASAGPVSFGFANNDGARLYIDDVLFLDGGGVQAGFGVQIGTINLGAGFHSLRFEFFENLGDATAYLVWDPAGGTFWQVLPAEAFVRTDAGVNDPTYRGYDDLVIADASGFRLVHGRARAEWTDLAATSLPVFGIGSGSAVGVGDVNGDGREDFATLTLTAGVDSLRIFSGGGLPQTPALIATITGSFDGLVISAAGDVDGDARADLLLAGANGGWLLLGGSGADLPSSTTMASRQSAGRAFALPGGAFRAIGDVNGDGFADLGAAVLVQSDRLSETGKVEHQVLDIYLGGEASGLAASFAAPDVRIEPGRALYVPSGLLPAQPLYFGPLGELTTTVGGSPLTRTLLGVSGPGGDALRVYDGSAIGAARETDLLPPARVRPEPFVQTIANPTAPGFFRSPPRGIDLSNEANPRARDAFVLDGSSASERLSRSSYVPDFNGDGLGELMVRGDKATYLLFGPVEVDGEFDVTSEADLIIDTAIGRPVMTSGDVNGDGVGDLVFIRRGPSTVSTDSIVITIIAGGEGGAVQLPRTIDQDWVDATLLVSNQQRVRVRTETAATGFGLFGDASASSAIVNWNDDGKADLALVRSFNFGGDQGYVFSGDALWNGAGDLPPSARLLTILGDSRSRGAVATQVVGGAAISDAEVGAAQQMTMIAAGDVNGDGLADLLLVDAGYVVFPAAGAGVTSANAGSPPIGRAYLITGRTGTTNVNLLLDADLYLIGTPRPDLILQDFAIGPTLAALGDLNRDGYDDFAIGSSREGRQVDQSDRTREGGLFVFLGQASYGSGTVVRSVQSADIIVSREATADIPSDVLYYGTLTATAGDFNGDGRMDLAVGESARLTATKGGTTILGLEERGQLGVFFTVMERGSRLALSAANSRVEGQFEFDRLGVLPATPGFDLDGDRIDDLVVGAPGADVVTDRVISAGGKLLVIYGASSKAALPPTAQVLANRTVTGSGDFLVDNGTGRPEVFQDPPGTPDNKIRFSLLEGEAERWYKFTTLGDGQPGNAIRITPEAIDGFVAPIDSASSAVVALPTVVGNSLVSWTSLDGAIGSLFLGDAFTQAGRVTKWSIFAGSFSGSRLLTPVIFQDAGDGKYRITGIGATRSVTASASQKFDFDLVSGSDVVGPGYYLGWKDGSATADNAGVVSFYNGYGDQVRWFGPGQGAAGNVVTGRTLAPVSTFSRLYSLQAEVVTGTVLEFDLSRFLGWAGDPDAVGSAKLILDAPTATDPVAAPSSPSYLTYSGGKLFFTAYDSRGTELWVTDGTVAGTRFLKDINPGPTSSYPYSLVDVGGTLFFLANQGAGGTELWKSDGTRDGTVKVADVAGYPSYLTAQPGRAELAANLVAPAEPAVDYALTIELLRESGQVDVLNVVLPRAQTEGNTGISGLGGLLSDLQAAVDAALGAPLAGQVLVGTQAVTGGTAFTLTRAPVAGAQDIAQITVRDPKGLLFAPVQASALDVRIAAGVAPDPVLASDLDFSLTIRTVGGTARTLNLTLNAAATADNATVAALATDLQAAVSAALVPNGFAANAVLVQESGGKLVLRANEAGIVALTIADAATLGFAAPQSSTSAVALTASVAAPANGRLAYDLVFKLELVAADGRAIERTVTLTGPETDGITTGALQALLQSKLNTALATAGFADGSVSVALSGGKFVVSITDARLLSFGFAGAALLGFEDSQISARAGDRLWFATSDAGGYEPWKLEASVANAVPQAFNLNAGAASSNPSDFVVVGQTLYFVADGGSGRRIYASTNGATPTALAGQTFTNPSDLVAAGNRLAFIALPASGNDRQVFSYDGVFRQLSAINDPTSAASPSGLTYFNGRLYFAAQNGAPSGYSSAGGSGRELWRADPAAAGSATLFANIAPDDPGVFIIPPFKRSSSPADFRVVGGVLYFSADNGTSGRELWRTNGAAAPALVADLAPGSASSSPGSLTTVETAYGTKLFFVSGGSLYVISGMDAPERINLPGNPSPYGLMAGGNQLFFIAGGFLWATDGTPEGTAKFDKITPPRVPLDVMVLAGEGDDRVTLRDVTAPTVLARSVLLGAEPTEVDITEAVRAAIARGDTRLTIRIENPDGENPVTLELAGTLRSGHTGLEVTPKKPGLVADLIAADGAVVALGKSTIDLRAIESGTYYLRVYNPGGVATEKLPFQISVDAPAQGYVHPISDRDRIFGGDGDDLIVGNQGLDRIRGESGTDTFIAERIEIRDLDTNERYTLPPGSERSPLPPEGPPVDAWIAISDVNLRVAIAEALGIPVTMSYLGTPIIHVDDADPRTNLTLANPNVYSQRILASDLAELTVLDAAGRGIRNLDGLNFAINLATLSLARNELQNGQLDKLVPATISSGEARGFPVGMANLVNLALDFNMFLFDLSPLEEFTSLERLSIDGAQTGNLAGIASLKWPQASGPERGLEFLSMDNVHGLTGIFWAFPGFDLSSANDVAILIFFGFPPTATRIDAEVNFPSTAGSFGAGLPADDFFGYWSGQIYIPTDGPVTFYLGSDDGSVLYIDNQPVVNNDGDHGFIELSGTVTPGKGLHRIDLVYYDDGGNAGVTLSWKIGNGPKQIVPNSVLYPAIQGPIGDVSVLTAAQTDLEILSLKGNVIEDVRPFVGLDGLEVLRLDGNRISNIEDLAGVRLIDDGDAGFEAKGAGWQTNLNPTAQAFEGDYHYRLGSDDDTAAVWTFTNLDPGQYEVLVTWTPAGSRADEVTYLVKGADNTAVVEGLDLFKPIAAA
ncbi:MAG: PA14 domain-containing protein, partial [Burkholderiales bacterium]|nr:PA14 domain-containing protein [Burkholderiales bacterium]